VSRHIDICVLVLVVESKLGPQGDQGILQVVNETLVESEDLVGIPTEQLYVFLREYGTGGRYVFLSFDVIVYSKTFADGR
jgi:hypothetical protein